MGGASCVVRDLGGFSTAGSTACRLLLMMETKQKVSNNGGEPHYYDPASKCQLVGMQGSSVPCHCTTARRDSDKSPAAAVVAAVAAAEV